MKANLDYLNIHAELRKHDDAICVKGYIMYKQLEIGYTWFNPANGCYYVQFYDERGAVDCIRAASTYSGMLNVIEDMADDIYNRIYKYMQDDDVYKAMARCIREARKE